MIRNLGAAVIALAVPLLSAQTTTPFDAEGYRIAQYRAVVPTPPDGVSRIDADTVARFVAKRHAILVDVMPAEGAVRDPATGAWRLAKPRPSIAGAVWFPEAGRGQPDPAIAAWFMSGIASLRSKTAAKPLILFCLADCWMSWNASRRLARAGYRNVYWFADGTDGWAESRRPLVEVQPFNYTR